MKRVTLFAKGNVDLHDSLHSCTIGGQLRWNGINDIIRRQYPGTSIRLRHETFTRSDALLAATGHIPPALAARALPLGNFPLASQFGTTLFTTKADAYILSLQPDAATDLLRHRSGFLFYPHDLACWPRPERAWLHAAFEPAPPLAAATAIANFERIIATLRAQTDAPILIYNLCPIVPGEQVHCLRGFGETFSTRARRFNLALAECSARTGVSIIDVDNLLARAGADRLKLDALRLTPEGYRLVAAEVVRVLAELGILEPQTTEACPCVPA